MTKFILRHGPLRVLLLLCLVGSAALTRADIIRGRIVDSETGECLPYANVRFSLRLSNAAIDTTLPSDSLGRVQFHARRGAWEMEVKLLGYETRRQRVMSFGDERTDTIDLGDIALRMLPEMLKMVKVEGRARRFTMRGDTIVFHPEAFHLEENARLDELLRMLPGVEADADGRLRWNGKPIRLTMDGEGLFGGDAMVGGLPARAVQDIKAYNKASELSERTGRDDGREDMVLDLSIKPGFLDRWYGDASASVQTPRHYLTELTLSRLSKTDPVLIFANANNTNTRRRRQMNGSTSIWSGGNGQEQGTAAGYEHRWTRQAGKKDLLSKYNVSGGIAHDDQWRTTTQETLNFLPHAATTRQASAEHTRTHQLNPYFDSEWLWRKDTLNTFTFELQAEHTRRRDREHSTEEHGEVKGSSPSPYAATLLQQSLSETTGHSTTLRAIASWEHYVKNGALGASAEMNFADAGSESYTQRRTTHASSSETPSLMTQHAYFPSRSFKLQGEVHYERWLTKQWLVKLSYWLNFERQRTHQDFETDGTPDASNSYRNRIHLLTHGLHLSSTLNVRALQLMPKLSARWIDERQDYERGWLDTTAVRRRPLLSPSFTARWKVSKGTQMDIGYEFSTQQPTLFQTLAYRDTTNPLFITEGNPSLKDSHTHQLAFNHSSMLAKQQLTISSSVSYRWNDREERTALRYNSLRGIYTSRPVNVHGSRSLSFRLNYDQSFGSLLRLKNSFSLSLERRHALLVANGETSPLSEGDEGRLSTQSVFHPTERLTFSFDNGKTKASLFAEIDASRHRFSASPEQNTTLWENKFGASTELRLGQFVVSTQLTEQMYHGYTIDAMNRNLLIWNASVAWKFLRGKARLTLDFDDILNAKDNYWSSQSASHQTTIWTDNRHHYAALTFTYHLDAKEKNHE